MSRFRKWLFAIAIFALFLPSLASPLIHAQGNTLNVQVDVEISTLDPSLATDGQSMNAINTYLEGLMNRDAEGNFIPGVAESYETNDDKTVYTFKLRDDANWANGDPVTANDFIFSWQRLINPDTASEYSFLLETASIKNAAEILKGEKKVEELGVKAIDDKTLEVTLTQPTPYFLSLLTFTTFYPINQKFFESTNGQFGTSPETVLSNGPFIVKQYEPAATTMAVEKNPDYFDADKVSLDGINFQVIKDAQQSVLAYQTGQVDMVNLTGEQVALFANDPEMRSIQQGYIWYLSPNQDNKFLANKEFRLALGMAFDRKALVENVLKDGSLPATYFIPRGLVNNPENKDFRDVAGEGLMDLNLEQAQAHWAKAKEELGTDSFKLSLLIEDTEASINVAQSLEAQLEQNLPGLDLQIEQTPKKNRLQRMDNGEYELGLTRWGPDYADPTTYLQLLVTGSSYNYQHYSNEAYDKGYEAIMTGDLVNDEKGRWDKMVEMEKMLLDDAAVIPIYQKTTAVLVKSNIDGLRFYMVGGPNEYSFATKK